MVRDKQLIKAIMELCTSKTLDRWKLNFTDADISNFLTVDAQTNWPSTIIAGHFHLLADCGFVELSTPSNVATIVRVTSAGYDFLESVMLNDDFKRKHFV